MTNDDTLPKFEWDGHLDKSELPGALLELATFVFAQALQLREGKNQLSAAELAGVLQQTVSWANGHFPNLNLTLK